MIQLLLAAAFSSVPLTLYVPPVRNLTMFVQAVEEMVRETGPIVVGRYYQRIRIFCSRILGCIWILNTSFGVFDCGSVVEIEIEIEREMET
ncbi:hypothetical protein Droror1_Dr00015997, partial [Drosera rotundifolia]